MNEKVPHIPVLFDEVLDAFSSLDKGYIIDCTTGYGGHSEGLLKSNPSIKLICNDQDDEALAFSQNRLKNYGDRVIFHKGNFENVVESFKNYDIKGILADIGVSSLQLDKLERGFGFMSETLDMRMNQSSQFSAKNVVNEYSQSELERIFRDFGELREYKKAASLVVANRPFSSAKELTLVFEKNFRKEKINPATLPFQAIRIEVNRELEVLEKLFDSIENAKLEGAIVAIISFHSLEDRIVKNYFKKWSTNCICPSGVFRCTCGNDNSIGEVLTKKPIIASAKETKQNTRSRSAKLRIFKFYDA